MQMLQVVGFSYRHKDKCYRISPLSGNLLQHEADGAKKEKNLPVKVADAMRYCANPYSCGYPQTHGFYHEGKMAQAAVYHKKLIETGNKRYLKTVLYSSLRKPLFEDTAEAFSYIEKIQEHDPNRDKLCLQRSFLALKTSKSFLANGVLFIGALLPSGTMHAWIIENGFQPDVCDRQWILYAPLLAYYYG
jgi:hypothetical protein